jgi:predicted AlkP superfamily phosphohydrolase/phosphomutase
MASNSHRMVIIGLDGMPYRLIKDLAKSEVMPNTRAIIENGVFRQMETSIISYLTTVAKPHTRIESLKNRGA